MDRRSIRRIHSRSVFSVVIYVVVATAFVVLGLYPAHRSSKELDREISDLQAQLEEQKILFPLYQEMSGKMRLQVSEVLPFPEKTELPQEEIDRIPVELRELAVQSKLQTVTVTPDVKSLENNSKRLLVEITAEGEFLDFRTFVIKLGRIPYLDHIEEMQIKQTAYAKLLRLKVWLALG